MIKRVLVLLILVSTMVFAEVNPSPSKYDSRITFVKYNPDDVFNIYTKDGFVTILVFDPDERIISAGTGFNSGWDISQSYNILHIKPKVYISSFAKDSEGAVVEHKDVVEPNPKDWNTNIFITTNKRTYIGNLKLSNRKVYYKISFKYPREERARYLEMQRQKKEARERANIKRDLNHLTVPRNWNYLMKVNKGSDDIAPDFVYDDGVFTYIGFKAYKTMPTAFLRDGNNESILNTHIKEMGKYNVLVVHRLAKLILLRSGNKLVGILNNAYGQNPLPYTRETTSNAIKREIR